MRASVWLVILPLATYRVFAVAKSDWSELNWAALSSTAFFFEISLGTVLLLLLVLVLGWLDEIPVIRRLLNFALDDWLLRELRDPLAALDGVPPAARAPVAIVAGDPVALAPARVAPAAAAAAANLEFPPGPNGVAALLLDPGAGGRGLALPVGPPDLGPAEPAAVHVPAPQAPAIAPGADLEAEVSGKTWLGRWLKK